MQLPSISQKSPPGSPVYLPPVEVNLAALSRFSRSQRGGGVCAAVYLWGGGSGWGSQRSNNSSVACGGLAKHVLDHTAVFLRGLRSCDSAFLSYAWPLGAVAYKTRTQRFVLAHTHTCWRCVTEEGWGRFCHACIKKTWCCSAGSRLALVEDTVASNQAVTSPPLSRLHCSAFVLKAK